MYICDNCDKKLSMKPKVTTLGLARFSDAGILLPTGYNYPEKHFCDALCAWKWCAKGVDDLRNNNTRDFPK